MSTYRGHLISCGASFTLVSDGHLRDSAASHTCWAKAAKHVIIHKDHFDHAKDAKVLSIEAEH